MIGVQICDDLEATAKGDDLAFDVFLQNTGKVVCSAHVGK